MTKNERAGALWFGWFLATLAAWIAFGGVGLASGIGVLAVGYIWAAISR